MEYEVRFYFYVSEKEKLLNKFSSIKGLNKSNRKYEKTIQYNHCDSRYDFYSKEIDGRFRIRISKEPDNTECKLSWKQRIKDYDTSIVNQEIEKEIHIKEDEIEDFQYIVQNVMHFNLVESYERYRTTFSNDDIEIALDEYPFGIAVEIENKSKMLNPEENVLKYVKRVGLDISKRYCLSWDDKYAKLCQEQNIPIYKEVTFDKEMPSVF